MERIFWRKVGSKQNTVNGGKAQKLKGENIDKGRGEVASSL